MTGGALTLRPRAEHPEDKLHATQCGDTTQVLTRPWQAATILNKGETDDAMARAWYITRRPKQALLCTLPILQVGSAEDGVIQI